MWSNFFEAGGWGMYPVALFGFLLVASGILFVLRPRSGTRPIVASGILTFGAGLLGMCTGMINTFRYVQHVEPADQFKIAALGCAESLNDLVLALMIIVFATLLGWVGTIRAARTA